MEEISCFDQISSILETFSVFWYERLIAKIT